MTVSLLEREVVSRALSKGLRADGRNYDDFRPVEIEYGNKRGFVKLSLGQTKVQAAVTAEIARPFPDRPFEGQVSFFVEFSSTAINTDGIASTESKNFGEVEEILELSLQRSLERAFKASRAIDTESLCIVTGQKVWNVRVDLHVIDDDGNLLDAVVMAALTALVDFRRPEVKVDEDGEVHVYSEFEKHPVPLSIQHFPISVTFALFKAFNVPEDSSLYSFDDRALLVDPSALEHVISDSRLSVIINRQGEIVNMCKPGGVALPIDVLLEKILPLAKAKALELSDVINERKRK